MDKLDRERAQFQLVARLDDVQLGLVEHLVLFETPFHQRQREGRPIDGYRNLRQQEGNASDVIFVAVGQDQPPHVCGVLFQVGEIRRDDVHAHQLGIREHHPGIHDNDVVPISQGHAVHSELAQPAERDNLQLLL